MVVARARRTNLKCVLICRAACSAISGLCRLHGGPSGDAVAEHGLAEDGLHPINDSGEVHRLRGYALDIVGEGNARPQPAHQQDMLLQAPATLRELDARRGELHRPPASA